jgi:phosphate transport system substrate-binding protein
MKMRSAFMAALLLLLAPTSRAQSLDEWPPYQPQEKITGTIRTWGHVFVKDAMKLWEEGFQKFHPDVRFEDNLVSSAAATGALFTKTADIGFVGREIRPMEIAGYNRVMKFKPYGVQVMTGAYTNPDKSVALGVFVHRENPLARLTFAQLDAIFGAEHRRGAKQNIRTWGQFGLSGAWADKPITVYQGLLDAAPAFYFSVEVLKGSLLWNENTRVFDDLDQPGGKTITAGQQIVDALGTDRYGIALAGAGTPNPNIKLLAIARDDGGPFVAPTVENVANRTYPLARSVWLYVNRTPGAPLEPKVREFLRYILSREGQAVVQREGDYFPLTPELAAAERKKIE